MTPAQLSLALKKIASKLEASKSPSKELVLADLKKVVVAASKSEGKVPAKGGKVGQTDDKVAAYKAAFEQCSAEMRTCQEKFSECWASHDYKGAADACAAMSEVCSRMSDNKTGNEHVHAMLTEAMKGSHKASARKASSLKNWAD